MHVLVMAKAPVAGRVKTRLCPPCTPDAAAAIARAALCDTLDATLASGADRCILALDGEPGDWLPAAVQVIAQHGATFGERLAHAWAEAGGPGIQIGMDTPQVTPELLDAGLAALDDHAAGLGPAVDGGWWAIALRRPDPHVFFDIPMSTPATGAAQWRRLVGLGLDVAALPVLRDVDTWTDALAVADECQGGRFASAVGVRV